MLFKTIFEILHSFFGAHTWTRRVLQREKKERNCSLNTYFALNTIAVQTFYFAYDRVSYSNSLFSSTTIFNIWNYNINDFEYVLALNVDLFELLTLISIILANGHRTAEERERVRQPKNMMPLMRFALVPCKHWHIIWIFSSRCAIFCYAAADFSSYFLLKVALLWCTHLVTLKYVALQQPQQWTKWQRTDKFFVI